MVLAGEGEAAEKRLALLDAAGAGSLTVYSKAPSASLRARAGDRLVERWPSGDDFSGAAVVLIAGIEDEAAEPMVAGARAAGALVNCEDRRPWCDFHVPAMVRRGDLTLTISTGGKSPGLARRLKAHLEQLFGPEWANRLDDVAVQRNAWRAEGLPLAEVGRRVERFVDEKGWLS